MKKFCIVVPIYQKLTPVELLSVKQLIAITKFKYDIYLVHPDNIDNEVIKIIYDISEDWKNHLFEKCFSDEFFKSTETYSELLETNNFWQQFADYEYVYIYQTDCWLFRDEFEYWCDRQFDYIGGPIIAVNANWKNVPVVGNGGFSLRRVSKFIEMTSDSFIESHKDLLTNKWRKFEDLYFIQECGRYTYIDTPIVAEAVRFSWDMNPDIIYKQVKDMPFGIHAVDKNIPFWKQLIPEFNNKEIIDECYRRNKMFIDIYYENSKDINFSNVM